MDNESVDKSVSSGDSVAGDAESSESESVTTPALQEVIVEGRLTPRHRRFAQLLALQTVDLKELSKQTGYAYDTCRLLAKDPNILKEVYRLQDKVFEETVKEGLKSMKQTALDHIRYILFDDTNRVKAHEKTAVAQWVIEKLDGKATQTTDVGENTLALLFDRLDQTRVPRGTIDVTPNAPRLGLGPDSSDQNETKPRTEEDALDDWVADYVSES